MEILIEKRTNSSMCLTRSDFLICLVQIKQGHDVLAKNDELITDIEFKASCIVVRFS